MLEHYLLLDLEELFEFSYNIIHIKDAKPNIDIKIVGGKKFSLLDLVEKYKRPA
jgi:hypothetical protein